MGPLPGTVSRSQLSPGLMLGRVVTPCADAAIGGEFLAGWAEALEGTWSVDALTTTADASYHRTLINICTHLHHHECPLNM